MIIEQFNFMFKIKYLVFVAAYLNSLILGRKFKNKIIKHKEDEFISRSLQRY